jgi:hypothetical protein
MLRAILLLSVLFSLSPRSTVQDPRNDIQITLERTICFGRCPIYRVTIRGDGSVTYEGWKFVKVEGTHGKKIPAAKVQELVRAFTDIDFFNLKDVYDSEINADGSMMTPTDMPMIITSLTLNGRTKRVEDSFGAPQKLRVLERKIDQVDSPTCAH